MAAGAIVQVIELIGKPKGCPVRYTCDNATGIEKGEILALSDPRTVVASSADNEAFAGISAEEKVANDGSTSISAWTKGIFDINASAAIAVGARVSISGDNEVATVVADSDNLFSDVGIALEAADEDEIFAVLIGSGF
jgi:hypothetical protein